MQQSTIWSTPTFIRYSYDVYGPFKNMSKKARATPMFAMDALRENNSNAEYLSGSLKGDKEFILDVMNEGIDVYDYLRGSLKKDTDINIKAIQMEYNHGVNQCVGNKRSKCPRIALAVILGYIKCSIETFDIEWRKSTDDEIDFFETYPILFYVQTHFKKFHNTSFPYIFDCLDVLGVPNHYIQELKGYLKKDRKHNTTLAKTNKSVIKSHFIDVGFWFVNFVEKRPFSKIKIDGNKTEFY